MDNLDKKVFDIFSGRVVPKGATKKIKNSANVPTYVLEYLLGTYCTSDDEREIEEGIEQVKRILSDNYVRPDEAEKIKAKIKEYGNHTVIDKISVKLNERTDQFEADFLFLGIHGIYVQPKYVREYEKLLAGGIWSIVDLSYLYSEDDKRQSPFVINDITPIQMPNLDKNEIIEARQNFTKDEWIDLILRSSGMEPTQFEYRVKWHLLARLVPLVENNVNICELGPRGTGKSHIYKELSPNSILVSGGQTTVANLFYNMARSQVGLVGLWDCVAFDEVAGISFKDKDGIQIMKDYMASGSFARGKDAIQANASMVFVGNINQSVDSLLKTSHLFEPFPDAMIDSAFFDRMHTYIPGWEIPKMRPEFFTDNYGFISDYIAEFFREMRKVPQTDAFDKYFKLGRCLNQRDTIAVRKMVSGLVKIIYPDGRYTEEEIEEILKYAIEGRRRVKEQLKKIGGMEFYDVQLSYIKLDDMSEIYVSVLEQGGGQLIPEGASKPGHVFTIANGSNDMKGLLKLETTITDGNGKFDVLGLSSSKETKESVKTAQNYFRANARQISKSIMIDSKDYLMHMQDCQGVGVDSNISLAVLVAYCSCALNRPVIPQMVVLGSMSIGGTVNKVEELASVLQVAFDAGAKKVLIPMSSAVDIASVPADLFAKFQLSFYSSPEDAVIKSLGAE